MPTPIAHIENDYYLSGAKCVTILLDRFRVPLLGVNGNLPKVTHFAAPHSTGTLKSVQKSATDRQKAKENVIFWRRKIHAISYWLKTWSVIPERVLYAIARPVPDRVGKQFLRSFFRFSLKFDFRNSENMTG